MRPQALTAFSILLLFAATSATDVIEIYVAVDNQVVQNYISVGTPEAEAALKVEEDATFFLSEVNRLFATMSGEGVDLQLRVKRLDVLDVNVYKECSTRETLIQKDLGLLDFKTYLENNDLYNTFGYDVAMLWTGFDIFGDSDSTAGYATVDSVCKESTAAIAEFDGTYRAVYIAAHEIGHVLGLAHDTDDCDGGYVMGETLAFTNNRWLFSSCSIDSLLATLPSKACLRETDSESTTPSRYAPDELLDFNIVCERKMQNVDSYLCKSDNLYGGQPPQGDLLCQRIYCYRPDDGYCYLTYPTNGAVCAEGKRCELGQCVDAPDDFPVPDTVTNDCLVGDQEVLNLGSGSPTTCGEFFAPADRLGQCYSESIEKACCETCGALANTDHPDPGCLYGDKSSQCVQYTQAQVCPSYADTLCCQYCLGYSGKRSFGGNGPQLSADATEETEMVPEQAGKEEAAKPRIETSE